MPIYLQDLQRISCLYWQVGGKLSLIVRYRWSKSLDWFNPSVYAKGPGRMHTTENYEMGSGGGSVPPVSHEKNVPWIIGLNVKKIDHLIIWM